MKELNLSNATVSTATDMSYFLDGCTVLEKLNMSNFKAPLVTTLSKFFNAFCAALMPFLSPHAVAVFNLSCHASLVLVDDE